VNFPATSSGLDSNPKGRKNLGGVYKGKKLSEKVEKYFPYARGRSAISSLCEGASLSDDQTRPYSKGKGRVRNYAGASGQESRFKVSELLGK